MLKRLENKLMMLKAVLALLKQNSETLSTVPALAGLIARLEGQIAEIESWRQITESDNTGITDEKDAQEEALIEKTYELSSALYAMATEKGDMVLQAKVDFTESDLQNARGNDLVSMCTSIADLVGEHLVELADSGVTEPDLAELESLKSGFSANLPTHRITVAQKKAANEKQKEIFQQADQLLDLQIDRLMVRFRNTAPDLYATYVNARRLVQYGIRYEHAGDGEA